MRYYQIRQGKGNIFAEKSLSENFIGVDFGVPDLTQFIGESNLLLIIKDIISNNNPNSTKLQVGAAAGSLFRFVTNFQEGDKVLVPFNDNTWKIGEIIGGYEYFSKDSILPHRKKVQWIGVIDKGQVSQEMLNSLGSIQTIVEATNYSKEIELLLSGKVIRSEIVQNSLDQQEFALESHLEDFIIQNWNVLDLGKEYNLFTNEDGEIQARQFPTEVGPIDILAVKKDNSEILILELKKGRSGDAVVGQLLRYITAIKNEVADKNQKVRGIIITGKDDKKIQYSIDPLNGLIEFLIYSVSFTLNKIK